MASQERLEYFISAAFKDEGVRQAMQAFGKLNAESAKVVNELNRISDAGVRAGQKIRDSRTPYAQLGMQVNQLGSQLAGGTSFAVAFAQQIGDVGWALSNTSGILGSVGRFLAGPWGAAIAIAATALGPLIFGLQETSKESKAAEKAAQDLDAAIAARRASEENLRLALAKTSKEYLQIRMEMRANAQQALNTASIELEAAKASINALKLKRAAMIGDRAFSGGLRAQAEFAQSQILDLKNLDDMINGQLSGITVLQTNLEKAQTRLNASTVDVINAQKTVNSEAERNAKQAEKNANRAENELKQQQSAYDILAERLRDTITLRSAETNEIGRAQKALDDFNDLVNKVRSTTVGDKLLGLGLTQELAPQIMQTRDALKQAIIDAQEWKLMIPTAASEATKAWEDQKAAIDSVAMSVNDAFKGMLTAGSSWKDGMKGIINTVINELWRLFVVQQIVGMVSKFVGGILGGGPVTDKMGGGTLISDFDKAFPKNANGTPSWQGGLTWVGERGPELVNLPRGAGVIPAHRASQMGGGGMTINVDARGSADPAAVRAQVQQGILEAAPAIVAAAQQRTVAGLRRPKLGGVMQ